ncbi:MAG: glycine cleavage system aminomethyltransferase GcvT [Verrucomicrobiota bacterium]|nr:glycine cleavage system aminomethyltransferase GcvT [Verrucomicrobiota bacterium]
MKKLFLDALHRGLGGKIVPFGGWDMPVQYKNGILREHEHTRSMVSLFDISHMGEFRIRGKNGSNQLEKILARPVVSQKVGSCRYNFLMNAYGGIKDDLIVYKISDEELFLVVNAATTESDADYIKEFIDNSVEFEDVSKITGKLDLQGPKAVDVLTNLGIKKETLPRYFRFKNIKIKGIDCLISRTGYTGELGFEFYVNTDSIVDLWKLLSEQPGVQPAGLGCRDTLRLEMGYPLYGHELDEKTTPIEAGFAPIVHPEKHSFISSDILIENKPKKFLHAIQLDGRRAAREKTIVFDKDHNKIGIVTSGSYSPSIKGAIALAYLNKKYNVNSELKLELSGKDINGKVVTLPFYQNGTVRNKL